MKNLLGILILALIPISCNTQKESKITYIANDGFLMELGGKKVLIDALFEPINEVWCDDPGETTLELMKKSEPPFDGVDIIAITHNHRDHFNASTVISHLLNNPDGVVICPDQVAIVLSKYPNYETLKDRIISITPGLLSDTTLSIAEIPVRVLRLEHSHFMIKDSISGEQINKHANIENLGFVFNIQGTTIFHCGDTNPINKDEYSTFELNKEGIDIALLSRSFYAYGEESIDIVDKYIAPEKIVLMHISPENMSLFLEYFKDEESIKIFEEEMESVVININ